MARRRRLLLVAAGAAPGSPAGGGSGNRFITVVGAIASMGGVVRRVSRTLAGAKTPTGALTKQPNKLFAGAKTPTGALTRQPGKALGGTKTPTGALIRQPGKALSGTNTPAGALATAIVTAPTVRASASASGASAGAAAVVNKPAGLTVGDLMLAVSVGDNDGTLANLTGPSGWTAVASQTATAGAQPGMKVWQIVATSTETAASNFSFSAGTGIYCSAAILAITVGTFNTTTPLFASPTFTINAANSTSHVAPSIATGQVNGLLITAHSTDQGGAATNSYTPPSGMTEVEDTAAASAYTGLEIAKLVLASTAATGTKTATCTNSRPATSASLIVGHV